MIRLFVIYIILSIIVGEYSYRALSAISTTVISIPLGDMYLHEFNVTKYKMLIRYFPIGAIVIPIHKIIHHWRNKNETFNLC